MRISLKLALALFAGTGTVWAVAAKMRETEGARALEAEAKERQLELGEVLSNALATPCREGEGGLFSALRLSRAGWVESPESLPEARQALRGPGPVTVVDTLPDPDQVITYLPVAGERRVLKLSTDLEEPEEVGRRLSRQMLVYAELAAALLSGGLALAVGQVVVARPVKGLVAHLQRIGRGEASASPVTRERDDEFGLLAGEVAAMEARLEEARKGLAREVAARLVATDQLRHADRLATGGMVLAEFAHEITTPLEVIASRARPLAASPLPDLAESGRMIAEQVSRLTVSSRRLLDYTRKSTTVRQPFDLLALAAEGLELLQPAATGRSVRLAVDGAPVRVMGDPSQILQAYLNIAHNGVQAMNEGGELRVRTAREAGEAILEVEDHGEGISSQNQERIFEPFFTTKPPGRGTGLGLPVAREIVEDHGGRIEFTSRPGQGSVFRIILPALSEER